MKKQFFSRLSGIIPAMALLTTLHAQPVKLRPVPDAREYVINDVKVNTAIKDAAAPPSINQKALNDFKKSYKYSEDAGWAQIQNGCVVKFRQNGVETRVFYDNRGKRTASVLTYTEDKLPRDIRAIVKSTYYDYKIYLVHEVTVGDKTAYLVSIQDDQHLKTMRILDNEMDVFEDLEKF